MTEAGQGMAHGYIGMALPCRTRALAEDALVLVLGEQSGMVFRCRLLRREEP